jgi:TM2 domain-containing membrane protein YozV
MKTTYSLPAFLSFVVPGLGQLIKKQFGKAAGIFALTFVLLFFLGGLVDSGVLLPTIILLVCLWVWNIYDAYNSKQAIN